MTACSILDEFFAYQRIKVFQYSNAECSMAKLNSIVNLRLSFLTCLVLIGSLLSTLALATARLEGNIIISPYVTAGDVVYSAVLELVTNSNSVSQ